MKRYQEKGLPCREAIGDRTPRNRTTNGALARISGPLKVGGKDIFTSVIRHSGSLAFRQFERIRHLIGEDGVRSTAEEIQDLISCRFITEIS